MDLSFYSWVDYTPSEMFEFIKVHIVLFPSKWSSFEGRFRMLVCFVDVTSNLVLRMC